jgi:hypothetical protein
VTATDDGISLREYVDLSAKRLADSVTSLEARMTEINSLHATSHAREHGMTKDALDSAAAAMNTRLTEMNEFRRQITDERANYLSKAEFMRFEEGLNKRLDVMAAALTDQGTQWARLFGGAAAFGFLITVLSIIGFVLR